MTRLRLCLLALPSALSLAAPAQANSVTVFTEYTFVGPCLDCTELGLVPGYGIGELTLENYTLGDPLTTSNLVSFVYYPTGFTIAPYDGGYYISGSLPTIFPSAANVEILSGYDQFTSSATGSWCAGSSSCNDGFGSSSVWNAPEPSTWVMMLLGFAGLGFAGYRQARTGAAPIR